MSTEICRAQLGVGTAALALSYGAPGAQRRAPARAAARRTLLAAVERGVGFIDTAPAYGEAEALVGETLGARGECVVATKLAIPPGGWGVLGAAALRAHVRASVRASLRALRRERLDVLQIHNAQEDLIRRGPLMEALHELREEGQVARLGATVYGEATRSPRSRSPSLTLVQVAYSALDRRAEPRVLPAAMAADTAVVARSLLLHGVLTTRRSRAARALRPAARRRGGTAADFRGQLGGAAGRRGGLRGRPARHRLRTAGTARRGRAGRAARWRRALRGSGCGLAAGGARVAGVAAGSESLAGGGERWRLST